MVKTTSRFNLFEDSSILFSKTSISVFPLIFKTKIGGEGRKRQFLSNTFGIFSSSRRGRGIEIYDTREYLSTDDFRHIDWKKTSRYGKLMSKEFETPINVPVNILLDHSKSMGIGSKGETELDCAIRISGNIIKNMLDERKEVSLITFTRDRITEKLKNTKPIEMIKTLTGLQPDESKLDEYKNMDRQISISDVNRIKRLEEDASFFSVAGTILEKTELEYLSRLSKTGLNQALKSIFVKRRSSHIVVLTNLESGISEILEGIRLAVYYGYQILVIVIPHLFFKEYDLLDADRLYEEYRKMNNQIRRLKNFRNLKVLEIGPRDRIEGVMTQLFKMDRGRHWT